MLEAGYIYSYEFPLDFTAQQDLQKISSFNLRSTCCGKPHLAPFELSTKVYIFKKFHTQTPKIEPTKLRISLHNLLDVMLSKYHALAINKQKSHDLHPLNLDDLNITLDKYIAFRINLCYQNMTQYYSTTPLSSALSWILPRNFTQNLH